jgi:hypothetical protein
MEDGRVKPHSDGRFDAAHDVILHLQRADLVEGARARGAQERLQFGERQVDGIEVGLCR